MPSRSPRTFTRETNHQAHHHRDDLLGPDPRVQRGISAAVWRWRPVGWRSGRRDRQHRWKTLNSGSRIDGRGVTEGSARIDRSIDRRSGRVRGGTQIDSALDGATGITGRRGRGAGSGGVAGSLGGDIDARPVGTDDVRAVGRTAAGTGRSLAQAGRDAGSGAVGNLRDTAGGLRGSGSAAGSGLLSGGTLALAGSAAANGAGSFDVAPGMAVVDAKRRAIGTVRDV